MLRTSQAGLEFIARQEGEVLHVYHDQVGVPTIGIGHALKPGESFPGGITHEQALSLLASDVAVAERAIHEHVTVELSQAQFDALVSFTFNLGSGALASSTLLVLLNRGSYDAAADEFLHWDRAGGHVLPGLQRRRAEERELFLSTPSHDRPTVPDPQPAVQVIVPDVKRELPEPDPGPPLASGGAISSLIDMLRGGGR